MKVSNIVFLGIGIAIGYIIDEYIVFPAIFHNVPSPFDWLFVIIVLAGELKALSLLFK